MLFLVILFFGVRVIVFIVIVLVLVLIVIGLILIDFLILSILEGGSEVRGLPAGLCEIFILFVFIKVTATFSSLVDVTQEFSVEEHDAVEATV